MEKPEYDVVIMGGGLAGLTLSIQLKQSKPSLQILVMERRDGEAATAAHKVGESTVELGSYYFRHVLGLKDYLEEFELPKHGLRFFFKSNTKEKIDTRLEMGPRAKLPVPSHQIDRGTFENFLTKFSKRLGNTVLANCIAKEVDLNKAMHTVKYKLMGEEKVVTCRWVVDASSRVSILKRQLGFQKTMDHGASSAWWRVKGVVDIDNWSENKDWRDHLEPKLRYLSTVHFMDKGYWFWVIPLGSQNTSLGIVADPAIHPLETYNTHEKAMNWLKVNEPLAYEKLTQENTEILDFLVLKHYAHHSGRLYDGIDRWAVTGEAGAFLDPFYSPGSDLISLANTWITDLIVNETNGEDVALKAKVFEQSHLSLVDYWLLIYQNKYPLMGHAQIMVVKIFWDWAIYWAITTKLFVNNALTDLDVLRKLFATKNGVGVRFGELSNKVQAAFIDWQKYDHEILPYHYVDVFDVPFMIKLQSEIEDKMLLPQLMDVISENMNLIEHVAVSIMQMIAHFAKDIDENTPINPYLFELEADPSTYSMEGAITPNPEIKNQLKALWFYTEAVLNE